MTGFTIMKSSECCVTCNRSGKSRPSTDHRDFITDSLKIGYTFNVTMKSTAREKHMPKIFSSKSNPKYRCKFENYVLVIIVKACCDRLEGCNPGTQQYIMTRSRAGRHVKGSNETFLFYFSTHYVIMVILCQIP